MIDGCYQRVKEILTTNGEEMEKVAAQLLKNEVIEGKELDVLLGIAREEETTSKQEQSKTEDVPGYEADEDNKGNETDPGKDTLGTVPV